MLQPFLPDSAAPAVNLKKLTRWLVQLQGADAELGGLKGRTNKLVDGCYAWWVGGSFALLSALGVGHVLEPEPAHDDAAEEDWHDADGTCRCYYSRRIYSYFLRRFTAKSRRASKVHSLRRATSCRRFTRQAAEVSCHSFLQKNILTARNKRGRFISHALLPIRPLRRAAPAAPLGHTACATPRCMDNNPLRPTQRSAQARLRGRALVD